MFEQFRKGARDVMTGTGGQLRVPIAYLDEFIISLPPIEMQEQFESFVRKNNRTKFAIQESLTNLIGLERSILAENFN
jgi:type I restriction enzyme S subunit